MDITSSLSSASLDQGEFRVLIVYPNLPLMLLVPVAVGLFTKIFKDQGYVVDLFDTTHYKEDRQVSYGEQREEMLNSRVTKKTGKLNYSQKTGMLEDFHGKVESFKPNLIIYSAVVEDSFFLMLSLVRAIKNLNIPHLIGGVFPTYAPELCMGYEDINMIGIGEGEKTTVEVAEAIRKGLPFNDINGIWYRDSKNKIIKQPAQPLTNINDVIPDYSLFNENRFWRPLGGRNFKIIPIETYRGCPYTCTFCNSPSQLAFANDNNLGNFLRRKTMKQLRAEIESHIKIHNPTAIFFVDDSFLARPRQEIFDFCDMYEDIGLPFWFNSRAENCEADTLLRLKEVGVYRMTFGIECGNEEYRANMLDRKITNEKYKEHIKIINESGIPWNFNIILGMPAETRELVMDSVNLLRLLKGYDSISVSIFTPYHGTKLRKVCLENGWIDDEIVSSHITARSVLKMPPPYLNADEIDGLSAVFPLYCYYPKSEWDQIKRAEIPDKIGGSILGQFKEDYRKNFLGEIQKTPEKVMALGETPRVLESELVVGGTGCRTSPKDAFIKNIDG
jgi:anaerobic magnesium-protoporphyrin IX monomethyl ester cyclase